jgi:deoxyribodipyrimidine photo-lyase
MKGTVPPIRIRKTNKKPINPKGDFVLYWMIANRRSGWNFSLQRGVDWARELNKPLVILEALRLGYPWASDRFHAFILDGMADNEREIKSSASGYYPYVEQKPDGGKGLLIALAKNACVIITDDYPAFFIPNMLSAASKKISVLLEAVDSNGLLPMRSADRVFTTAYAFRRFLQKSLPNHLMEMPMAEPLKGLHLKKTRGLPKGIQKKWPRVSTDFLIRKSKDFRALSMDHDVGPVAQRGGPKAAMKVLKEFIENRLSNYQERRNQPEEEGASGLSPYLHFGHVSSHQIFHEILEKEKWYINRLSMRTTGSRSGWWGMSGAGEAFLDELVTWRELGFNRCWQTNDFDRYASLPDWALASLKAHEMDKRPHIYALKEFEKGETHDPLWNAAQMQLIREGRIHNYLRMLWGKKILEWSATARKALAVMVELNNRYALDGRDPNSYTGIFWVLGRYDRAWGPERPIFGKIRYMSSENTARKVRVNNYIKKYARDHHG